MLLSIDSMKLKTLIKPALSIVMLALVMRFVDLKNLEKIVMAIPLSTVSTVVVIFFLGQVLSSYKWWLIARAGKIDVPYLTALRAYFIGMFVNCFGFGTLGGDVARGILLADGKQGKTPALASVIADRAQGLAVLSIIALVSVAIFGQASLDQRFVYLLLVLIFAVIALWFFAPRYLFQFFPETTKLGRILRQVFQAFPRDPKVVFVITAISASFHLIQIWMHSLMASGLGVSIPWPILLTTIPFVNILATLPISWNGLGVRENSYIFFLFPAILSKEQSVAIGAMWLLAVAITSSIGGILSVLTKDFETLSAEAEISAAPQVESNSLRSP